MSFVMLAIMGMRKFGMENCERRSDCGECSPSPALRRLKRNREIITDCILPTAIEIQNLDILEHVRCSDEAKYVNSELLRRLRE